MTREVQRAAPMISWEPVVRVSREKGSAAGGAPAPAPGSVLSPEVGPAGATLSTPVLEQAGNVCRGRKVFPNVPCAESEESRVWGGDPTCVQCRNAPSLRKGGDPATPNLTVSPSGGPGLSHVGWTWGGGQGCNRARKVVVLSQC